MFLFANFFFCESKSPHESRAWIDSVFSINEGSLETDVANLERTEISAQNKETYRGCRDRRVPSHGAETVNYSMTERLIPRQIPNAKHARLPEEA